MRLVLVAVLSFNSLLVFLRGLFFNCLLSLYLQRREVQIIRMLWSLYKTSSYDRPARITLRPIRMTDHV
jgi:hypothetical protein